ncbi:MAG: alkaline phosphatase [Oscillospiraceae bacterium]|nr:alkaline phosphatase [Oscillospiraceae bacterium]
MMKKRMILLLVLSLLLSMLVMGCGDPATETPDNGAQTGKLPKYIFMFIGDGMSYPQIQVTNYYLTMQGFEGKTPGVLTSQNNLSLMDFPVTGSIQTYDSSSFAPDSSSTATAMATGHKTFSHMLNVSENGFEKFETITEKLKEQKDYKIGIVTSVNLNHATPGAFYAHQSSRTKYYLIGKELVESGFDYFAGGEIRDAVPERGDDIYTLAQNAGYKVVRTQAEAAALTQADGKVIVIGEHLGGDDISPNPLNYEIDRAEDEWALADYVAKGIEMLDNDNGFFMMVEGGKIDWAGHCNDAATAVHEVIALDNAIKEALKFYEEHPDDTLIIVTGDHETGGLSIGYAGTDYDTFLNNLANQQISYSKFNNEYVTKYKANKTDFATVMSDITQLFGLTAPVHTFTDPEGGSMELSAYEYQQLQDAYTFTMNYGAGHAVDSQDYLLYGDYEPLTVAITHIMSNKCGLSYSSFCHTGLPTAVFAIGAGSEKFEGYYDNTGIYFNLAELTGVE